MVVVVVLVVCAGLVAFDLIDDARRRMIFT